MSKSLSDDNFKEIEWINKAKSDPHDFKPLYQKYYEPVFIFINRRLFDMDQAADITQQVFLKALEKLSKYDNRGVPFGAWLFRIAHNELVDFFRKNQNKRNLNIDTENLASVASEERFEWAEDYLPALKSILAKLDEDDLMLIEMRFFEKRPFSEIAEIMNLKESNTKIRLYRLLEKIRPKLVKLSAL